MKTKFNVGQRVRCIKPVNPKKEFCGSGWKLGDVFTISEVSEYNNDEFDTCYYNDDGCGVYSEYLELAEKTLDSLEVGDLIITTTGTTKLVIDVFPNSVVLSETNEHDVVDAVWSIAELKARGWTIKQEEPVPETVELSVAELEERLDLAAGTLRVKKD